MTKAFFELAEALDQFEVTEEKLTELVRGGKLREFRDAGKKMYKIIELEEVAQREGIGKKERIS